MVDLVDPQQFIIARKRKKYRFALFHNAENCFELESWKPLFRRNIVVEVGAGTGLFLVEHASRYPEQTFIALDIKADRLQKGARLALEKGLTNIFFVRARADQLLQVAAPETVQQVWLTFSDPFPKKRDAKNRLTHPRFLELYKNILVHKNAQLLIKTDAHALFDWSLEQLITNSWHIGALSYDLHDSALCDDYKIKTTYEQKWTDAGLPIMFVAASMLQR